MTPTTLAAALLKDVPRIWAYSYEVNEATSGAEPEQWVTHRTWETSDPKPILAKEYVAVSDILSALSRALDPALAERAGEVLEGVTDGPWQEGELLDTAVFNWWFAPDHPEAVICEAKTAANARFIAAARELVPALLAQNAALRANTVQALDEADREYSRKTNDLIERHAEQLAALRAERDELSSKLEVERALTDAVHRLAKAAEAEVEKLREAADWQEKQRRDAFARRHLNAPEDAHVAVLCERYGYGAVMDAASRLWARQDSMGAFYIGGCIGISPDAAITEAGK